MSDQASEPWRPLSIRTEPNRIDAFDVLQPGVPSWLRATVAQWTREVLGRNPPTVLGVRHDPVIEERVRALERTLRTPLPWASNVRATVDEGLLPMMSGSDTFALDVLDALLTSLNPNSDSDRDLAAALQQSLTEAGSVWQVGLNRNNQRFCLVERVTPEMQAIAKRGFGRSRPGDHLREAWQRAYGRSPDATGAYREAVRAVEALLRPMVSPANPRATLGTMLKEIQDAPAKFVMRLTPNVGDPVLALRGLIETLWTSQLDRHGTDDESQPLSVSIEEARDAAVIAAMAVELVSSGGFVRKP